MKIIELNPDERPMERLEAHGASSLSNAELLAILIRTGNQKKGALDLARELLEKAGDNLNDLGGMSLESMCQVEGIGRGKAMNIIAAMELGKRYLEESFISGRTRLTSSKDVFQLMLPKMKSLNHEEFWVIWLTASQQVLGTEKLTSGGTNSTSIDQKLVLKRAIDKNAAGLVMIHNHPSGDPTPSQADIEQTATLKDNVNRLGINIIDHVIMAEDCFFSFAENTIIRPRIRKAELSE